MDGHGGNIGGNIMGNILKGPRGYIGKIGTGTGTQDETWEHRGHSRGHTGDMKDMGDIVGDIGRTWGL